MENKLITLVNYRYEYRAEILKSKLEEVGITCCISNETVLGQIDGVRVMINEKDYEKALSIYRKIRDLYDNHTKEVLIGPEESE